MSNPYIAIVDGILSEPGLRNLDGSLTEAGEATLQGIRVGLLVCGGEPDAAEAMQHLFGTNNLSPMAPGNLEALAQVQAGFGVLIGNTFEPDIRQELEGQQGTLNDMLYG